MTTTQGKITRMNSDTTAILALSLTPGSGVVTVRRLMAAAAHAEMPIADLVNLTPRELTQLLPSGHEALAKAAAECDSDLQARAAQLLDWVSQAGATALRVTDADYPASVLKSLGELAPPLLFVFGALELLDLEGAAVVGAREVSEGGALLAAECATALAKAGATIVSGGAPGVDSAAHQAALDAGGRTVVVLPQGLLTYRGPSTLMEAAENGDAAIVSEFSPDCPWRTHAAVTRNATISALSRLVCVIEPRKTGGSVRTARCGLEQGKQVLVHGGRTSDAVIATLRRAGAESILDETRQFNAARLQDRWTNPPSASASQADLFE